MKPEKRVTGTTNCIEWVCSWHLKWEQSFREDPRYSDSIRIEQNYWQLSWCTEIQRHGSCTELKTIHFGIKNDLQIKNIKIKMLNYLTNLKKNVVVMLVV